MNKLINIVESTDGSSSMYKLETTKTHINDSRIEMSFYGDSWAEHVRGKVMLNLKDHGNGVNINFQKGNNIQLGYDEIEELSALLRFYSEDSDCNQFVSNTIKLKEID